MVPNPGSTSQCPDPRTYYLEVVERKEFGLLANVLCEPEMVQAFVETYNDERKAMAADSIDERKEIARRLTKIEKDCDRWTEMLFNGDGDAKSINAKTRALREDECTLKARLSILDETKPEIRFQPDLNLAARYAKAAEDIQQTLGRGDEVSPEIIEAVRMMVSKVVIRPDHGNAPDIETFGLITALSLPVELSGIDGSGGGSRYTGREGSSQSGGLRRLPSQNALNIRVPGLYRNAKIRRAETRYREGQKFTKSSCDTAER